MNQMLPRALRDFIAEKIRSGQYASEDDVVRAGLEALRYLEAQHRALLDEVDKGIADADAGRYSAKSVDQIIAEMEREFGD